MCTPFPWFHPNLEDMYVFKIGALMRFHKIDDMNPEDDMCEPYCEGQIGGFVLGLDDHERPRVFDSIKQMDVIDELIREGELMVHIQGTKWAIVDKFKIKVNGRGRLLENDGYLRILCVMPKESIQGGARVFIREKKDGFYIMTYKGPLAGPYLTYAQARKNVRTI